MGSTKESLLSRWSENGWFLGAVCGFYVLLFYYANNYSSINSWQHLSFFTAFFIGIPVLYFLVLDVLFTKLPKLKKYHIQARFVSIIIVTATLLSWAMKLRLLKKILLVVLILAIIISFKAAKDYKKLIPLILVVACIPLFKNLIHIYEHKSDDAWREYPLDVAEVTLKHTPNIYVIQPDGYVSQSVLEQPPYEMESPIYDWLRSQNFKVYDDFRSNYPASLASNASMFAMQQHRFGDMLFPTLEVPNARVVIQGDNPVISTLARNGYKTHFIVEDEYFQQNRAKENGYDYHNIPFDTIPYFSDDDIIEKDVIQDFKKALALQTDVPSFYFIERVLPHHVHFINENRIAADKAWYAERIKQSDVFIKETVGLIKDKDPEAIIVVLADHGGWVGIDGFEEMYTTDDPNKIASIYSTLSIFYR